MTLPAYLWPPTWLTSATLALLAFVGITLCITSLFCSGALSTSIPNSGSSCLIFSKSSGPTVPHLSSRASCPQISITKSSTPFTSWDKVCCDRLRLILPWSLGEGSWCSVGKRYSLMRAWTVSLSFIETEGRYLKDGTRYRDTPSPDEEVSDELSTEIGWCFCDLSSVLFSSDSTPILPMSPCMDLARWVSSSI